MRQDKRKASLDGSRELAARWMVESLVVRQTPRGGCPGGEGSGRAGAALNAFPQNFSHSLIL